MEKKIEIPEGYEARIEGNKIILEPKESEDERIRKELIQYLKDYPNLPNGIYCRDDFFAWLEKQGEQNLANSEKTCKDEQKPTDNIESSAFKDKLLELFQKFRWIKKGVPTNGDIIEYVDAHIQELINTIQNPAWSEEDETGLNDAMWAIEQARTTAKNENDMGNLWYAERWLKSLKSRVQPQPKSEWSEEDEIKYMAICDWLCSNSSSKFKGFRSFELSDWLNSLKEKCTWRPSDEQMSILFKYAEQNNADGSELTSLYNDLKKLKE